MKRVLSFTLALFMLSGFAIAQDSFSEKRDVSGFNYVAFGVSGDVYVTIGDKYSVVLEGNKDLIKEITTVVKGEKLMISSTSWNRRMTGKLVVKITMPEVKGLAVSGSGNIYSKSDMKGSDLSLVISGSGNIILAQVKYESMESIISGSGNIKVEGPGSVASAEVKISGSGGYYAENVQTMTSAFVISGSGSSRCNVSEKLTARVSGSGSIIYDGEPRIDATVSGSGRVRSK